MAKSTKVAYVLWLFGGLMGAHHIYLGRDKQAIVWFATFGGFLIGLLRDLYKIPEYVKEANDDPYILADIQKSKLLAPAFYSGRFFSCLALSTIYGYFMLYVVPSELETDRFDSLVKLAYPLVIALMVYLAGTEIPLACSFRWPLLGSYLGLVLNMLRGVDSVIVCSLGSTLFLNWNIKWNTRFMLKEKEKEDNKKKQRPRGGGGGGNKRKMLKRAIRYSLHAFLIVSLVSLFVWNHASVDMDGKKVTIKETIKNFLNSKELTKLTDTLTIVWNFYRAHGFTKLKNQLLYGYDPEAIARAYKVVELNEDKFTQQDLDNKCRILSRKWHPDKFKDAEKKVEAEMRFMEIQESCNLLSEHRKTKIKQNKKEEEKNQEDL